MAQIPDPNQMQRRMPRASSTVATYRGDVVGNAVAQFGADVAKFAEVEGNRIDESRVDQAYTELRQKRAELSIGEGGYASVKGDRVVHTPDGQKPFTEDYQQKFNATVEGIASRLSPAQRTKFNAQAAKEGISFQTDVMRHAMKETETFHAEAREGALNTEMQLGAANWSDQNKVADSWGRINEVYNKMITVDGQAADKVNSLRAATLSKLHSSVLEQANAAGNTEYAKAYFEANKGEILQAEVVGAQITKAEDAKVAMEVGVSTADKFLADPTATGDIEKMNRAIREDPKLKGDPDRIHAAQREAAAMVTARRDALNQKDAAVDRMLIEGKPLEEVKRTKEFRALSLADQNKILKKADSETDPSPTALATYYNLKNDGAKLSKMTPDEVILFGSKNNLGKKMTTSLLETNSAYKTKPAEIAEAKVDTEAFNVAYRAKVGKNPLDKGERENADKAKLYVEDRVDAAQRQLGRKLERQEKQIFINEALQAVPVKGAWWGTNEKPLFAAQVEKVVVPAADRVRIAAGLKKVLPKGVEPSELDIQQLYVKDKQIPLGR